MRCGGGSGHHYGCAVATRRNRADGVHLLNTGTIIAEDAAITIGNVDFDGPGLQPQYQLHGDLNIFNSGTIISQDEAIDASEANRPVELILRKGSVIVGNLIDLPSLKASKLCLSVFMS